MPCEQHLPELHGLGVRVVDPEDAHALAHPQAQDPLALVDEPVEVGVEGDRVDVLVLLRRVLGVGDRAVGPVHEPFRVLGHPRMIWGCLQREVQSDLEAVVRCDGHEVLEVGHGPEVRVHRVMPARLGADRPRGARVVRAGSQCVVRPLAEGVADRVDRGKVHDVEAHCRDSRKARGSSAEGPGAWGVERGALGAGEELVPRAVEGTSPFHAHGIRAVPRGQLAQGEGLQRILDCGGLSGIEALLSGLLGVAHRGRSLGEHLAGMLVARAGCGPVEDSGALLELELDIDPGRQLDLRLVLPGLVRVAPGDDVVPPLTLRPQLHVDRPAVGLGGADLVHPPQRSVRGADLEVGVGEPRRDELGLNAHGIVAFAERGHRHREGLADHRLDRVAAAFDDGADIYGRVATDHLRDGTTRGPRSAC